MMISVVMPVFRTDEDALSRAISSVLNQTYDGFELVIVDDGNDEVYARRLDDIAKKDLRIKVVHKVNGGVSSARNAGLAECKGEYVAFVDSDDEISQNFLEESLGFVVNYDLDFVSGRYVKTFNNQNHVKTASINAPILIIEKKSDLAKAANCLFSHEHLKGSSVPKNFSCGPCARLMKRTVIDDIRFDEGIDMCEDAIFVAEVILNSKRIGFVDNVWHVYRQNSTSIYHSLSFDNRFYNHLDAIMRHVGGDVLPSSAYAQFMHRFLCTTKACASRYGLAAYGDIKVAAKSKVSQKAFSGLNTDLYDLSKTRIALRWLAARGVVLPMTFYYYKQAKKWWI